MVRSQCAFHYFESLSLIVDADVFNNICGMLRDTGIAVTLISLEWAGAEFSALLKSCSPL